MVCFVQTYEQILLKNKKDITDFLLFLSFYAQKPVFFTVFFQRNNSKSGQKEGHSENPLLFWKQIITHPFLT
jgi:hypothetical protein